MELLTAAQMRAAEQAAIASGAVTGLDLMERAGCGVVEAIMQNWPEHAGTPGRAVVFCGPGNNGGDGFVVARLLKGRGWSVDVFLYGEEAKLPADAAENCRRWREMGDVRPWRPADIVTARGNLFVDALFGAGLTRALPEEIISPLTQLHLATHTFGRLVAVDAPSGLCLDSGRNLNLGTGEGYNAVFAWLTVTFQRLRPGHFLGEGPRYCGVLHCVDIGLDAPRETGISLAQGDRLSDLGKHRAAHKYDHGHALILSGGVGRGGAARLAARGALRIGAGLVTLGCPPAALIENAARLDAIMLRPIADAEALTEALGDRRINALCLGPGLGLTRAQALVPPALTDAKRSKGCEPDPPRPATLLDADALTAFEDEPEALFARLHPACVLTPHLGEFGRLFPDLWARLADPAQAGPAYSRVDAVREAAARAGCVVLLKGADTVIAGPDGRARICSAVYDRAAPWLATAGSGDVLAGFITGLLARGLDPLAAAETAALLHVDCALRFGPGLIAEDIPEQLPAVFRTLAS